MDSNDTLLDVFRSVKRTRKQKVFPDSVMPVDRKPSSERRSAYQAVKEDSDVEKCRGFSEWRVKAPNDGSFPGVAMYATFDSLPCALSYASSLRTRPKARKASKSARPTRAPEQCLTTEDVQRVLTNADDVVVDVEASVELSSMFGDAIGYDLECSETVPSARLDCQVPDRVCGVSPLTLPEPILSNVIVEPNLMPDVCPVDTTTSILDKRSAFHIRMVSTTQKHRTDQMFVKTLSHSLKGEFASPFMYNSLSFKFGAPPLRKPPEDELQTPAGRKRKRPAAKDTTPSSHEKRRVDISKPSESNAPHTKKSAQARLTDRFCNEHVRNVTAGFHPPQQFNICDLF
jgi:hypothetical protein